MTADASLALDAKALVLLDRLLDSGAAERAAELAALRDVDAALHDRLQRLLRAADDPEATRSVSEPLVAGMREAAANRPEATQARPGDMVAGWRLLRELGRGGMAVVWLAERAEGGLRRQVAIKLPLEPGASGVLAERFARERDVLAALDHPHIARLFDAGVSEAGLPYIVLEYVPGEPLLQAAAALPTEAKLALFRQVLSAVEHAHRHLVVHRDLKPANILVTPEGEVKLLDFGIAKLLDAPIGTANLTRDASAVLTPRYAAPEQVLGQPASTATDVYAAGVVLHELLTGRLPYGEREEGILQVMHAIVHEPAHAPGLSVDIDTIVLKALNKTPQERYASIERFDEDLRRLLAHEPILARRVPAWHRARLLVRRHPRAAVALAAGGLLLLATAGLAWQQAEQSRAQKTRGDAVRDFVFSMLSDVEPAAGRRDVTGKDLLDAAQLRARREFADSPRLRGELLGELGRVYFRLDHRQESLKVLEESLELLHSQAGADDPALNRTRAVLSRSLLAVDAERAATLARQALADCVQARRACADARSHAMYALSALASWRGDHAEALRLARAMVGETEAALGKNSEQLIPVLETLALAARNAEQPMEAAAALQRLRQQPGQERMRQANRNQVDLVQSTLDIDLGRYAAARDALAALLGRQAPADVRSVQWRVLAAAELGLGRPEASLRAAEQAQQALPPAPRTASHWLALQAWGLAASSLGRHDEALPALAQARQGLAAANPGAPSAFSVRAERIEAEGLLRARRDEAAAGILQRLLAEHRRVQPARVTELARTLDALGCSATLAGRVDEAQRHHAEAAGLYAKLLPPEHPLRLRSALLRAPAASPLAVEADRRYRDTFAPDSPWRNRAGTGCRDVL